MGCGSSILLKKNDKRNSCQGERKVSIVPSVTALTVQSRGSVVISEHVDNEEDKINLNDNVPIRNRPPHSPNRSRSDNLVRNSPVALIYIDVEQTRDSARLGRTIGDTFPDLQVFSSATSCIDAMLRMDNHKIFIIVRGMISKDDLKRILDMSQVTVIYFSLENHSTGHLGESYKIRGFFSENTELVKAIRRDVIPLRHGLASAITCFQPTKTEKSTRDLSQESARFISLQYLLEIMARLPKEDKERAKDEMLTTCRNYYSENSSELKYIQEFEDSYVAEKALWWYSRESFVYRLLNKHLRSDDSMKIFAFRFIIEDIQDQLTQLHKEAVNSNKAAMTVYRGQYMKTSEANSYKEKEGRLISINSYFSTSTVRNTALAYLSDDRSLPDVQPVLFTIRTTASTPTNKPFALIKTHSYFANEDEVLLSIGTVFRIDAVDMIDESKCLNISMTMCEEYDKEIEEVLNHLKAQIGESSSLLTFGGFLLDRGDYANVEAFCKMMKDTYQEDHLELATVYNNWGDMYQHYGDFQRALVYYREANRINALHQSANRQPEATTYANIAIIYYKILQYSEAIKFFLRARKVRLASTGAIDHAIIVKLYSQTALVYNEWEKDKEAKESTDAALKYADEHNVPRMHPAYAWLMLSRAKLLPITTNDEQNKAVEMYTKALSLFQESLPDLHPDMIVINIAMGKFYYSIHQYNLALEHYQVGKQICEVLKLPQDHSDLRVCMDGLQRAEDQM